MSIVILLLIGLVVFLIWNEHKEREKLLKMFMAKDLREVTDNEVLDKMSKKEPFIKPPDLASMDEVAEDEQLFDKHMEAVKAAAKEELKREVEV